ncbi:MAG: dihydropteroate synthase [Chloroflexi bacterium]|nr:dihydropteroate synthase [Chloroflexota bacterium]
MHTVYLALGTNLGDRLANLEAAQEALPPQVQVTAVSPVYETEPWGYTDQPAFLNQVLSAETDLSPRDLLAYLKALEKRLGRTESFLYGPRLIDLDILFYDDISLTTPDLTIPHAHLAERAFVLVPLADLAPDLQHPGLRQTVRQLLAAGGDHSGVRLYPGEKASDQVLPWGTRTFIMGVINVTPDSFSGDGLAQQPDPVQAALEQARRFCAAGADILDVGGESTRPGSRPVSLQEEMDRVLPVIKALVAEVNAVISIDTYKAQVAEEALQSGARWINDVWSLHADAEMAGVAARWKAPLILMHNRSRPENAELQARLGGRYVGVHYDNLIEDIKRELLESVALARAAGVSNERIILDPGIGFGKTVDQNLELIDRLGEIRSIGYPVLLGPSRKGFIGFTLNLPPEQRIEGTAAAAAVGITRGADIIRVHDVEFMVRVIRMTDAIVRRKMG